MLLALLRQSAVLCGVRQTGGAGGGKMGRPFFTKTNFCVFLGDLFFDADIFLYSKMEKPEQNVRKI